MKYSAMLVLLIVLLIDPFLSGAQTTSEQVAIYQNPIDFIKMNERYLIQNYHRYFVKIMDEVGALTIGIKETKELKVGQVTFWGLKLWAKGDPDWSYQEKSILINNLGDILFEKDFRQIEPNMNLAECGVPNYQIENMEIMNIGNSELLKVEIHEYYEPCVGQPLVSTITWHLYSLENYQLIDTIEVFYKKKPYGEPAFIRQSDIMNRQNGITVRTREMSGNKLINEFRKEYNLIPMK
ncbi:MAG: hypothetical protein Kow00108_16200 [Calditrichia bacterium]